LIEAIPGAVFAAGDLAYEKGTAEEFRDALESYLVEERILVPAAGVKGLLKRVLGSRIEQRRQQIETVGRRILGQFAPSQRGKTGEQVHLAERRRRNSRLDRTGPPHHEGHSRAAVVGTVLTAAQRTGRSDSAARTTVIGKANALGSSFQRTREQLSAIQSNLDQDLQADAHQVSVLTRQIADLNQQVAFSESSGQPANDARDQRQIKLQELARLTGATVHENSEGQVNALAGNLLLVSGNRAASLDATTVSANGQHLLQIVSPDGLKFDASSLFQSGEIGALLQQRDQGVAGSIDQLDTLAKALVDQVNTQHAAGFDYNGNAGASFFQPVATVAGAAALVQVASAVAADPKLIAAAQTANGAPGDNRNALALVNLRDSAIAALGNATVSGYFLSFLGSLGEQAQASQNSVDFQNQLLTQVQARRDGTSGVSIDEEMTNLILFQRAFEASSRLVTTSNELYQTLIDMTR
jgi:flagellar hook-associated protein 1 FlgK